MVRALCPGPARGLGKLPCACKTEWETKVDMVVWESLSKAFKRK